MVTDARHRLATVRKLPYDAEIEFLESTGTQWIDTGINYFPDFEIVCKLSESVPNKTIGNGISYCLQRQSSQFPNWQFSSGNNNNYNSSIPITEKHTIAWKENKVYTDGIFLTSFQKSKNFGNNCCLFAVSSTSTWPCIIYHVSLYDDYNTLIRDYIPVRFTNELGQSEGAMYDKVSGQLFRNQGSGEFVMGPDVAPAPYVVTYRKLFVSVTPPPTARDYISDGLIALWDGIENAGWGAHDADATVWKDLVGNRDLVLGYAATVHDNYIATTEISPITVPSDEIDGVQSISVCVRNFGVIGSAIISVKRGQYIRIAQVGDIYNLYANGNTSTGNASHSIIGTVTRTDNVTLTATGPWMAQDKFYQNDEDRTALGGPNWWRVRNELVMGLHYGDNDNRGNFGSIYNVRLYSRALTPDEIAHNYAIDKIRFNLP